MKIYSLLGVFILLAGSFYLASAQNQSMYAGQMNTSSPEEPSEPLEPLEPLIPIENIDLFDGTVSTLALSHVCLDTEQKRNRFDFKVIEPSEVAFQYSGRRILLFLQWRNRDRCSIYGRCLRRWRSCCRRGQYRYYPFDFGITTADVLYFRDGFVSLFAQCR